MTKKKVLVNYTSRDFNSIKNDLVQHAKRYYPESFQDFNEAGFGSLLLDTVAYVGDILSFYVDYQANESFLETANEIENVVKLAKSLGYKHDTASSSTGIASFYILVPADQVGIEPDLAYLPILKKNSTFAADNGSQFILIEDVDFSSPNTEIAIGRVDDNTGLPTYFAVKAYGQVISGQYGRIQIPVGQFRRFPKIELPVQNLLEIISVTDSNGYQYYEVENLAQDIIYRPIKNKTTDNSLKTEDYMRMYYVPRRFVLEKDFEKTYLQFGSGKQNSEFVDISVTDPSAIALKYSTKEYVDRVSFDPARLIETDNFGIVPENTTLSVLFRFANQNNSNIGSNTLTKVSSATLEFENEIDLDSNVVSFIRRSIEVNNEEPISGFQNERDTQNIKKLAYGAFSSQSRAVTKEDYKNLLYKMPRKFGSVERVNVLRDKNSYKRNINIYTISKNSIGQLQKTPEALKNNIKVWLNENKMINDTIDILDAKIINLFLRYQITIDGRYSLEQTLARSLSNVKNLVSRIPDIAEPFMISDVYRTLRDTEGVLDVVSVIVENKVGGQYSQVVLNLDEAMTPDGRYIEIPENCIYEFKYLDNDIKGVVV